jgi:uncharacterized protein (TIGR00730 family)
MISSPSYFILSRPLLFHQLDGASNRHHNEAHVIAKSDIAPRVIRKVCVYCGSSTGNRPVYREAAQKLGQQLVQEGISLVYGGGRVGLMGVIADSVLAANGEAIGAIPRALVEKEIAHAKLTHLHVVESMHQRKAMMADLSDAFVLLPGAFGSWEEFCETFTWLQLGIHNKPCGILNVAGYYDALLALAARAVEDGFLRSAYQGMIIVNEDPAALIAALRAAPLPTETKWAAKSER